MYLTKEELEKFAKNNNITKQSNNNITKQSNNNTTKQSNNKNLQNTVEDFKKLSKEELLKKIGY